MKQYKVLQWAFSFLKKHQREEKLAEILLQHMTHNNPTTFFANMQTEIDEAILQQYKRYIEDHALKGTPVQHIIGSAPFYGRDFYVTSDVLIPRFETEEVVYHAIEEIKNLFDGTVSVVDLGTGSGIIAITLALELANAKVYATDISGAALKIAEKNAKKFNAPVTFFQGDFLGPIIDERLNPDLIISNPPYIARRESSDLADTVKNFDPELALFAENDGLAAYESIVGQIAKLPKGKNRAIIFEIGYGQAEAVSQIIKLQFPNSRIGVLQDINGEDRIVSAIY